MQYYTMDTNRKIRGRIELNRDCYYHTSYGIDTIKFIVRLISETTQRTNYTKVDLSSTMQYIGIFVNLQSIVLSSSMLPPANWVPLEDQAKRQRIHGGAFSSVVDIKDFIEQYENKLLDVDIEYNCNGRMKYHCSNFTIVDIN